ANGRTMGEYMAQWLAENLYRDAKGNLVEDVRVDGIYFDVDNYIIADSRWDVDNDLAPEAGFTLDGRNLWGRGLDAFYGQLRALLPGKRIVGGARRARGFESLNGVQMEGWPVSNDYHSPTPAYDGRDGFDSVFQRYTMHMRHHAPSELYTENLSKTPTKLYPLGNEGITSNAAFRFAFATTLLDDGYFGQQNSRLHPDPWFDEYAVDVVPGSPTYGHAIASNPQDESLIRAHKHWLGQALGYRERLVDPDTFAAHKSLIANGGFEQSLDGWDGVNLAPGRVTGDAQEGNASLFVRGHQTYQEKAWGAALRGPGVSLVKGKQYTIAFAAKASEMRDLVLQFANARGDYLIPAEWTRVVHTFTANQTGVFRPRFNIGQEDTAFWLDALYLFEGNANMFWREFENGAVVVNATPSTETIDLGGEFLRIRGTGQDPVNDGERITSVTLPPWDAAILVRPENASRDDGNDDDAPTERCGAPDYDPASDSGVFVWEDTCTPGRWHLRASAGGSTRQYSGHLLAEDGFWVVEPALTEPDDRIDHSDTPNRIGFSFRPAAGNDEDGFGFDMPERGKVCLHIDDSAGLPLRVGPEGLAVASPIDLRSLESCAPRVGASCSVPDAYRSAEPGLFVWQDACEQGIWHVRAVAGGAPADYSGSIVAALPIESLGAVDTEVNDVVEYADPSTIAFALKLYAARAQDGFDFRVPMQGSVCLRVEAPVGIQVRVGMDARPMSAPIDLRTLAPCVPRASLGAPDYDSKAQAATLLWEDAETGRWHLRVTAGASPSVLRFGGRLSGATVSAVKEVGFEAKDSVVQEADGLAYRFNVVGRGEDGVDFLVEPGAQPCLDIAGFDSGDLLLGEAMVPVEGPLNLATLGACRR
ncbi:MAG: carbohydrate binding domain-containing protein, partial [Thiohalocapsa sp.]|nr:carbohydrate binding domain-containing protein [Thiohalocapsa sp.]